MTQRRPRHALDVDGALLLAMGGKGSLSRSRVELLEWTGASGSISQAARDIGMSCKAAWDAGDAVDNLADEPVAARHGLPNAGCGWSRCTAQPRPSSPGFLRGWGGVWRGSSVAEN